MPIPIAAIAAGVGVARKLLGRKPKRPDNRQAIAELRASRPTGYLTPEDLRAAEMTRGRLAEGVNAQAGQTGAEIGRRFTARGLAGSFHIQQVSIFNAVVDRLQHRLNGETVFLSDLFRRFRLRADSAPV